MFSNHILIAIGCLILFILYILYKVFLVRKKGSNLVTREANNSSVATASYGINDKNQEDKKLTIQERVELSWKFLYNITDIIINKFSKEDITLVNKYGHILLNHGGKYEHVVDLAISRVKFQTQIAEQNQAKGQKKVGI